MWQGKTTLLRLCRRLFCAKSHVAAGQPSLAPLDLTRKDSHLSCGMYSPDNDSVHGEGTHISCYPFRADALVSVPTNIRIGQAKTFGILRKGTNVQSFTRGMRM